MGVLIFTNTERRVQWRSCCGIICLSERGPESGRLRPHDFGTSRAPDNTPRDDPSWRNWESVHSPGGGEYERAGTNRRMWVDDERVRKTATVMRRDRRSRRVGPDLGQTRAEAGLLNPLRFDADAQ